MTNSTKLLITLFIICTLIFNTNAFNIFPKQNHHRTTKSHPHITLNSDSVNSSVSFGKFITLKQEEHDTVIKNSPIKVKPNEISYAQWIDGLPTNISIEENRIAQTLLKAARHLMDTKCLSVGIMHSECFKYIKGLQLPECELHDECLEIKSKSKHIPFRRLLPANYSDSLEKMRTSQDRTPLPQPRDITSRLFTSNMENLIHSPKDLNEEGVLDQKRNILFPIFTQFIEQDLARSIVRTLNDGDKIECCSAQFHQAPPRYRHSACSPILISQNDNYYGRKYIHCLNYVRSSLAAKCELGPAEQINEASHSFDLSQIYGNTREQTKSLRLNYGGLLKLSEENNEITKTDNNIHCMNRPNETGYCYKSGDTRVNVSPYITILHIIFAKNHNNIAKELLSEHSDWTDEFLFNKARTINKHVYQRIIYNDWANIALGSPSASQVRNTAVGNVEHGVSNEFAVAAIKFYNSMLPGDLKQFSIPFTNENIVDSTITDEDLLKLENSFYRPINLSASNNLNKILHSTLHQKSMAMDSGIVDDLTTELYSGPHSGFEKFGTDSLALDIMKGRDHGVTSYYKYASYCLNKSIDSWTDLIGVVKSEDLEVLQNIYKSVKDVDLIVGLLSEIPAESAIVGPTSVCILGDQLINSRASDQEFYDRFDLDPRTSKSFAQILCETTNLIYVPTNAFLLHSDDNPLLSCRQFWMID